MRAIVADVPWFVSVSIGHNQKLKQLDQLYYGESGFGLDSVKLSVDCTNPNRNSRILF